jgi:hypothetical protein
VGRKGKADLMSSASLSGSGSLHGQHQPAGRRDVFDQALWNGPIRASSDRSVNAVLLRRLYERMHVVGRRRRWQRAAGTQDETTAGAQDFDSLFGFGIDFRRGP